MTKQFLSLVALATSLVLSAQHCPAQFHTDGLVSCPVDTFHTPHGDLPVYAIAHFSNGITFYFDSVSTVGARASFTRINWGEWDLYNMDEVGFPWDNLSYNVSPVTYNNIENGTWNGGNLGLTAEQVYLYGLYKGQHTVNFQTVYHVHQVEAGVNLCQLNPAPQQLTDTVYVDVVVTDTVYVDVLVTDTVYVEVPADSAFCSQYLDEAYDNGWNLGYEYGINQCEDNSCPADFNGDGVITTSDLIMFLGMFSLYCDELE